MKLLNAWPLAAAAAFAALLVLAGCDKVALERLQPGVSNEGDVIAALGQPERIWQEAGGARSLEYNRQPYGVVNYMLRLDAGGVLRAIDQVLSPPFFGRIKPGMERDEVRYILGKPASETPYRLSNTVVWVWKFQENYGEKRGFYVTVDAHWRVLNAGAGPDPDGPDMRGGG